MTDGYKNSLKSVKVNVWTKWTGQTIAASHSISNVYRNDSCIRLFYWLVKHNEVLVSERVALIWHDAATLEIINAGFIRRHPYWLSCGRAPLFISSLQYEISYVARSFGTGHYRLGLTANWTRLLEVRATPAWKPPGRRAEELLCDFEPQIPGGVPPGREHRDERNYLPQRHV